MSEMTREEAVKRLRALRFAGTPPEADPELNDAELKAIDLAIAALKGPVMADAALLREYWTVVHQFAHATWCPAGDDVVEHLREYTAKGPGVTDDMVERAARAVYAWTYGEDVANHRWPHSVFANGFRNQARISLTAALGRG